MVLSVLLSGLWAKKGDVAQWKIRVKIKLRKVEEFEPPI